MPKSDHQGKPGLQILGFKLSSYPRERLARRFKPISFRDSQESLVCLQQDTDVSDDLLTMAGQSPWYPSEVLDARVRN